MRPDRPTVAVIGGSGLCDQDLFPVVERVRPGTEYGKTSDEIQLCAYMDSAGVDRTLAFLPRHGRSHTLAPHGVPYRANLAALRSLGVTQVIATCIAGSLRRRVRPGDLVVPDQFVNLTWGRDPHGPPQLVHVPMADPYCSRLRQIGATYGQAVNVRTHTRGTVVVIQGPRFSTRAESRWFTKQGWDLVNMTQFPECYLAREMGICYAGLALITDYDVGVRRPTAFLSGVTATPVLEVFHRNIAAVKRLLSTLVPALPMERSCGCAKPLPPEYYKQPKALDVRGGP